MKLLKFLAVFGLLSVQQKSGHLHVAADCSGCHSPVRSRRADQVQVSTRLVHPPRSTLRISGLLNVTRRREPLPRRPLTIHPKNALCKPVPHLIEFVADENPFGFEFQPRCIRVNRCSGCCGHVFFSCQTKRAVFRELQVIVRRISRLNDEGTLTKVVVEEHEACDCQCIIKAKQQCSSKADYHEDLCSCICRDKGEENACREQSQTKNWDPDRCTCYCREIEECTEGMEFDYLNCKCKFKDRNKQARG